MSRTIRRPAALLTVFLAALGAALLLGASPASAHAALVSSSPSDGQRLATVPTRVTLTFDEAVTLNSLTFVTVTDSHGDRVDTGPVGHPGGNGALVSVALEPGLPDDAYTETYRVVSDDSHPVEGVIQFVVGSGPLGTNPVAGTTAGRGIATLFDAARWISYAGLALLGGIWLLFTVFPGGRDDERSQFAVWTGLAALAFGAVAEFLLQGPYTAGQPLSSAVHGSVLDATLHSSYGALHAARLVLLGMTAVLLGRRLQPVAARSRVDDLIWPLGIGILYTFSDGGHPATTSPAWLSIGADMLHLGAMAAWIGGLVVLIAALLPRRDPDEYAAVLPVFSRVAFGSVAVMAVTGTWAAWHGVGRWQALWRTEYGLLVLGKIALFLVLVGLGNLSRVVIQRHVRRPVLAYALTDESLDEADGTGAEPAGAGSGGAGGVGGLDAVRVERMRRSVLVEIAIAVVVLALTAVLVSQPRGSEALAASAPSRVSATAQLTQSATAVVTIAPGTHGTVGIDIAIHGATARSIGATVTNNVAQIGPIPLHLVRRSPSDYAVSGVNLPVAGDWSVELVVTSSSFSVVTTAVDLTLK